MINEWKIMQKDITFTIFNLNSNLYNMSLKIFPAFSYHAVVRNSQTYLYLHLVMIKKWNSEDNNGFFSFLKKHT